jgi:hypothetical protein
MHKHRLSSKDRRKSTDWNNENHTHFKQLNKADPNTRATHSEHPMRRGIPTSEAQRHRLYQVELLLSTMGGKTWTVRELYNYIKEKNLVVLYTGANNIASQDHPKYIAKLLDTLVYDNRVVQVFKNDGRLGMTCWTFTTNKNIASRTLLELSKVFPINKIRYCIKCIVSLVR